MVNRVIHKKMKTINSTPNYSKKTFTLRVIHGNEKPIKYRTGVMTKDEFESSLYRTQHDWSDFLKRSNNYQHINH